jgi:prefoldin subunit 5
MDSTCGPPSRRRKRCAYGANCMVEYRFEEATQLLTKNLDAATSNLKQTEADIAYLRDQINTTDVNLSQVYNVRTLLRHASSRR